MRELGRFFKFTVVVQADHQVVDTGPYRLIRHPSYTGLLMAALGLGIALGTWLSIPLCLAPPLIGFGIRLLTRSGCSPRSWASRIAPTCGARGAWSPASGDAPSARIRTRSWEPAQGLRGVAYTLSGSACPEGTRSRRARASSAGALVNPY